MNIDADEASIRAQVRGPPGEKVTLHFLPPGSAATIVQTCAVPDTGTVTFVQPADVCEI